MSGGSTGEGQGSSPDFATADPCLIVDGKDRHYLTHLQPGKAFHYHGGVLPHDDIIGLPDGSTCVDSGGFELTVLRPRLADYILSMRRGAQVVYPKDIGPILTWADIGPGMTVLEAGTGSGALTLALVRAVGANGSVVSVERRADHAELAQTTVRRFFGEIPANLDLRIGDVEEEIASVAPDRVVLDVPEPWHVVPGAVAGLRSGGVFCCYLPTVPQLQQIEAALRETGCFREITSFEILQREWTAKGRSVRPSHRMVGHTGFVTVARKVIPRV